MNRMQRFGLTCFAILGLFGAAATPAFAKCQPGSTHCPAGSATPTPRPAPSATAPGTAKAGPTRAPHPAPAAKASETADIVNWTLIVGMALLAFVVAMYPVVFYIRRVWPSRQSAIFGTLSARAKLMYVQLYHSADAAAQQTPQLRNGITASVVAASPVTVAPAPVAPALTPEAAAQLFEKTYNKWFSTGRLIAPAAIVGVTLFAYACVMAIAAAKALVAPSVVTLADIPLTAVAAITGAYILVTMDTIVRVTRRDLLPDDLYLSALRLVACVPLGYAFASITPLPGDSGVQYGPLVALAVSAIPLARLRDGLVQIFASRTGIAVQPAVPTTEAPSLLSGVDTTVCERLSAIGINTITQLAYSDPVRLTERTSLGFVFVLDMVSQALAWVYLDTKVNILRPMGLRGAFELTVLKLDAEGNGPGAANAEALLGELPGVLGLTAAQTTNMLHQIADDRYARFLLLAYS